MKQICADQGQEEAGRQRQDFMDVKLAESRLLLRRHGCLCSRSLRVVFSTATFFFRNVIEVSGACGGRLKVVTIIICDGSTGSIDFVFVLDAHLLGGMIPKP